MTNIEIEMVTIEYGTIAGESGGWFPIVWHNGREHYSFSPRQRGYDRDVALAMAKASADDEAAHYVGDWDVRVMERVDVAK